MRRVPAAPEARRLVVAAALLLASSLLGPWPRASAQALDWPAPGALRFEPLRFDVPQPRREVLSNGIVVYLAEDHSLPLVQGVAYVDAPGVFDPADETGLAAFTASMLREGGAGGRPPEDVDAQLEFLAASVEAGSSDVLASISFSGLSDTLAQVLPVWRDVLVSPDFDPGRMEVERQRQLEAVRRVADNPVQVAVRAFLARVAEGHPSGASPTEATLSRITREDLVAFHDAYYRPASTVLAVTGDFDADAMLAMLEDAFGGWRRPPATPPEVPPFDPTPTPRIYLAHKDLQQSIVLVGQPAIRAYAPQYAAFTVADHILGAGGFSSRLFTDIRTRRGLAYATGSQLSQAFDHPGIFLAYAFTRADATGEVLGSLLDEITRLRDDGVTQAELDQSRETILNQSLFRDTSIAEVTQRTARVALLGLEPGYYARYLERLQALTTEDVHAAVQDILHPDGLVVLVVGDEAAFDVPLERFGEVERIGLE